MNQHAEIVKAIAGLLTTGDEADRCYASQALGRLKSPLANAALVERLRDEDIDVCIDAAEALGRIGSPDSVSPLLESLDKDPSPEVKTMVVEALGRIGGDAVVAPLMKAVAHRPEILEDDNDDWDSWWDIQHQGVKALGRLRAPESVPVLKQILEDEDSQDIEGDVARALARVGGEGEQILIDRLRDEDPKARRRAALALVQCDTSASRKALLGAFKDPDPDVRATAIESIGQLDDPERFLDLLLLMRRDPESRVRESAVRVISNLSISTDHASVVVDQLIPLIDDSDPAVRELTLKRLGSVEEADLIERLPLTKVRECLSDPEPLVVAAACRLLGHLEDAGALPQLIDLIVDDGQIALVRRQALLGYGRTAPLESATITLLTTTLSDPDASLRQSALSGLMALHHRFSNSPDEDQQPDLDQPPLEVVIATLRGEVVLDKTPETTTASDPMNQQMSQTAPIEESAEKLSNPKNGAGEAESDKSPLSTLEAIAFESGQAAPEDETSVVPTTETPQPLSTLDAIAIDNHELTNLNGDDRDERAPPVPDSVPEGLEEYADLIKLNALERERQSNKRKITIADDVRQMAARVLSSVSDENVVTELIGAINDENLEVRRNAALSLTQIAEENPGLAHLQPVLGGAALHLQTDELSMRVACAQIIGALGLRQGIPPLTDNFSTQEPEVQAQIIRSLVQLGSHCRNRSTDGENSTAPRSQNCQQVIELFLGGLKEPAYTVRLASVEALIAMQETPALQAIINSAFAEEGAQAKIIGQALRGLNQNDQIGNTLVSMLISAQNSNERRVVIELLEAIFS